MIVFAATATPVAATAFAAKLAAKPRGSDPTSERSLKPWLALGISERTYYRRKASTATAPHVDSQPEQHAAHAQAWFAQLDINSQLDHRSFVRWCLLEARRARGVSSDFLSLYGTLARRGRAA